MKFSDILLIILALLFFSIFFYTLHIFLHKLFKINNNALCDINHSIQIKYDLCKECNKNNKCYDNKTFTCIPCKFKKN